MASRFYDDNSLSIITRTSFDEMKDAEKEDVRGLKEYKEIRRWRQGLKGEKYEAITRKKIKMQMERRLKVCSSRGKRWRREKATSA